MRDAGQATAALGVAIAFAKVPDGDGGSGRHGEDSEGGLGGGLVLGMRKGSGTGN